MKRFFAIVLIVLTAAGSADASVLAVCASGCPYSDLQVAIDAAALGDDITVKHGETITGHYELPDKGAGTSWITIRTDDPSTCTAPGVPVTEANTGMGKIVTTDSQSAFFSKPGAHHFLFECLEIASSYAAQTYFIYWEGYTTSSSAVEISDPATVPHDIKFDRIYMHGNPTGIVSHGIVLGGARESVTNSLIKEIHDSGADAQTIVGWNGPGPYDILRNHLEASGETVMFGGANSGIPGVIPSDIHVAGNFMTKPLEWFPQCVNPAAPGCNGHVYDGSHWVVKNCFELKSAQRVLYENNTCENAWTPGQNGAILLLNNVNSPGGGNQWNTIKNVVFRNSIFRHGNQCIQVSTHYPVASTLDNSSEDISFSNLLCSDVNGLTWGSNGGPFNHGWFVQLGGVDGFPSPDIRFDHITVDNELGVHSPVAFSLYTAPAVFPNLSVKNSIWRGNSDYGPLYGDGSVVGTAALNAFAPGPTWTWLNNVTSVNPTSAGFTFPPTTSLITDATLLALWPNRASQDYTLAPGSIYKAGGVAQASDGTDVGVDMCQLPDPLASDALTTFATTHPVQCAGGPPPPPINSMRIRLPRARTR